MTDPTGGRDQDAPQRPPLAVRILSTLLELAGLAVVPVGLYQLAPWAGIVAAGAAMVTIGVLLDPPSIKPRRDE